MKKQRLWRLATALLMGSVLEAAAETPPLPQQTARINEEIAKQWLDFEIRPSKMATDSEWCRRVYLDILGRIPSVQEQREFRRLKGDKRPALVRRLLYGDAYVMAYARNWSTIWTNLLIGGNGGNERNSLVSREGTEKYLRDAFAINRPYDQIVREVLTATGETKPGTKEFNGAVNFLVMKIQEDAIQATSQTAKLFLGKQVQCTQCHGHPFNEWKQNQFWELNSFFRQAVALRRYVRGTREISHGELTDQDFAGEGAPPTVEEAEVYYEPRNAMLRAAYPVFIDGKPLPNRSGLLEDVNRRHELAVFILRSEEMPRAIVNRMWSHFLGYGFTQPIDDMGPHNPPTHPELLDYLANQFTKSSFDLKQLIEWIVLSKPYGLSSRAVKRNQIDDPTKGETPKFSRFYLRQMRAEALYESLLMATRIDKTVANRANHDNQKREWLRQFVVAFGNDEAGEVTTFDGSISQVLMLFNGELVKQAMANDGNSMLHRLAGQRGKLERKVDFLFQAALARRPTKDEIFAAKQLVAFNQGDVTLGLQDLWWAILNSNEFILNH